MENYYVIFINSLKASIITSIYSENAWFAALQFGAYNVWAITAAAILGSGVGNLLNFGFGYYLGKKREDWFVFNEKAYSWLSRINNYTMVVLLFPFSAVDVIGVFWSIYVLATGFFCLKPGRAVILILLGRLTFYGYYLLNTPGVRF